MKNTRLKPITLATTAVVAQLFGAQLVNAYECQTLPQWVEQTPFVGGTQVQHQAMAFKANWWSLGRDPVNYSGQFQEWSKLGDCDSTSNPVQVSLTSPLANAIFAKNDNVVLSANADIQQGDSAIDRVVFSVDNSVIFTDTAAPFSSQWTAQLGSHVISAQAFDNQGNSKTSSVTISVQNTANVPPSVSLTSPTANAQIKAGDLTSLAADATDSDGTIALVEFYVDDVNVGNDDSHPYTNEWLAIAGSHSFKAVATDNVGEKTISSVVTVAVADGQVGGGCSGIPTYAVKTAYQAGDEVQNHNQKYRCNVAGWCGSDAAWAYEPGVGSHWQDAWSDLGICAIVPEVSILTPADNGLLALGKAVNFSAAATDTDGSVSEVEFFVAGASLAVDTTAPYSVSFTPTAVGELQLKVVAKDNEGNVGQSTRLVNVTDQTLVANLTSPASGTTVQLGNTLTLAADAIAVDSNVAKVDFLVNGAVVASDSVSPYASTWIAGSAGDYSITARATDATGATVISSAVNVKVIAKPSGKKHKLIGYWHNFINGAGCPLQLSDMSNRWDVIDIAFADNDRNSNGTVLFNLFAGKEGCPAIDANQFKQDMANLQNQGKVFVLSLGGAEGTITLNTDSDEANFTASLTAIIKEWGFDGLDIDLESGSNLIHGSQIQTRLGRALKTIEANIGGNMYLTMAPEHPYVQGGMIAYSGIWGAYIPLINELRDTLDLLHVQLYNNGGLANPYTPGAVPAGSVDMMVASIRMLTEGFTLADGSQFAPLRDDQVAIGLPSGPSSAGSGLASSQNIINALDCLTVKSSCDTITNSVAKPNLGGVMTWSINWDKHDGFNFSGPIGDKLATMNNK